MICNDITVQGELKAENIIGPVNVQGSLLASEELKCQTLKFGRIEYSSGGTQAISHFHKHVHVGSLIIFEYEMAMYITQIETQAASSVVIITVDHAHGMDLTTPSTTAECKFTGSIPLNNATNSRDVNGITDTAGFQINSTHKNAMTPLTTTTLQVTLSSPATTTGTATIGLSSLILRFPRWKYLDMANESNWTTAYGFTAPTPSFM